MPVPATETLPETSAEPAPSRGAAPAARPPRWRTPLLLFLITCLSTFIVGATNWSPMFYGGQASWLDLRMALLLHWRDGLAYSGALLAILLSHEMGHFVAAKLHRVPASLPFFLPFPLSPLGTMGAVIGMDGRRADRRQIFDIGLAGPLAGLVVALPVMWFGCQRLQLHAPAGAMYQLDMPLLVELLLRISPPADFDPRATIWLGDLVGNPLFMAGWVGMLITGLNMLPVSQLDGGHLVYTLFGRNSRYIARGMLLVAVAYMVVNQNLSWLIMVVLVMLIGPDHPPTRDDRVPLGWFRTILGYASLSLPFLCFAPGAITPAP